MQASFARRKLQLLSNMLLLLQQVLQIFISKCTYIYIYIYIQVRLVLIVFLGQHSGIRIKDIVLLGE